MERDRYSGGGFLEVGKAAASFCGKAWRRSDSDLLSQEREKLLYCVGGRKGSNFLRGIRRYFFTCFVQDTGTAASGCTEKSWRNPALFSDADHLSTVSCTVFSRGTDYISGNRDFICWTIRGGKDHAGKTLGEVQKCQDHLQ